MPSPVYWIRLYAVERAGELHFAYGYAVSAKGSVSDWKQSSIHKKGTWQIRRYNRFIKEDAVIKLTEETSTGVMKIDLDGGQADVKVGQLMRRPQVYAFPRTFISSGSPQSFSDELAEVVGYWDLKKQDLWERIFPKDLFPEDGARAAVDELLGQLQDDTGIHFLTDEVGRFGNLEIVNYLSDDFRKPDGLCVLVKKSNNTDTASLHVWIESPLADGPAQLIVNCSIFNGGGSEGNTSVLDETKIWQPGVTLRFVPNEPPSEYRVSVWRDGKLVACQQQSLLRSFSTTVTIQGQKQRVSTDWSRGLPAHLRDRAEIISRPVSQKMVVGSDAGDPWRNVEYTARAFVNSGFSEEVQGQFFPQSGESNLAAVEFIASLILRPAVRRVVIADPYFDNIGVQSLLARVGAAKEVVVLTSHPTKDKEQYKLPGACEAHRALLPASVSVFNVENETGSEQQFHDRYILIEKTDNQGAPTAEVWMLSNSFSSLGRRYPLVVVMLPPQIGLEISLYLKGLERGAAPGKTIARLALVWAKTPTSPTLGSSAKKPVETSFPWQHKVSHLLVPRLPSRWANLRQSIANRVTGLLGGFKTLENRCLRIDRQCHNERVREAVTRGILKDSPSIDWHVSPTSASQATTFLKKSLSADKMKSYPFLRAVAHWAYHGGPSASDYGFDTGIVERLRDALRESLVEDAPAGHATYQFEPLASNIALPESLAEMWHFHSQIPFSMRSVCTPEIYFYAEALWSLSPKHLVQLIDELKSFPLLSWICLEGSQGSVMASEALLESKLGIVQSLGVIFLHNIAAREAAASGMDPVALTIAKLGKLIIPRSELLLAMAFVAAKHTNPSVSTPGSFAACASLWGSDRLSEADFRRLTLLLSRAAPNRAIVRAGELSFDCPLSKDSTALHQWCLDQLCTHLPIKERPIPSEDIAVVLDDFTLARAAHSAWSLHNSETPTWFVKEVLKKLDFSPALEPLLRQRDYNRWNGGLEGVLIAALFGLELEGALQLPQNREEFHRAVGPQVADTILKLGVEPWIHFLDIKGALSKITGYLAKSPVPAVVARIRVDILGNDVPTVWALWTSLHIESPTPQAVIDLVLMTKSLSTPACDRNEARIESWSCRLISAGENLKRLNPGMAGDISRIIQGIQDWRNSLLDQN